MSFQLCSLHRHHQRDHHGAVRPVALDSGCILFAGSAASGRSEISSMLLKPMHAPVLAPEQVRCSAGRCTLTTGGSSPRVFQTTPPQPASKARMHVGGLVGGRRRLASQKGLGLLDAEQRCCSGLPWLCLLGTGGFEKRGGARRGLNGGAQPCAISCWWTAWAARWPCCTASTVRSRPPATAVATGPHTGSRLVCAIGVGLDAANFEPDGHGQAGFNPGLAQQGLANGFAAGCRRLNEELGAAGIDCNRPSFQLRCCARVRPTQLAAASPRRQALAAPASGG